MFFFPFKDDNPTKNKPFISYLIIFCISFVPLLILLKKDKPKVMKYTTGTTTLNIGGKQGNKKSTNF